MHTDPDPFPDPPRNWPRVGVMAAIWALVIASGSMMVRPFIAGGAEPDPRDVPPESAAGAVHRYLNHAGSVRQEDQDRAWATLCEGADPELDPDAIREMTAAAYDRLGAAEGVDMNILDEEATTDDTGTAIPVLYYVNAQWEAGRREIFEWTVTVRQDGDAWCVVDAVETPTPPELVPADLTGSYFDAVDAGDYDAAAGLQCDTYTGLTPEEIAAITHPILKDAEDPIYRDPTPYEEESTPLSNGGRESVSSFDYVENDPLKETVHATFTVAIEAWDTVQESCVASVTIHSGE